MSTLKPTVQRVLGGPCLSMIPHSGHSNSGWTFSLSFELSTFPSTWTLWHIKKNPYPSFQAAHSPYQKPPLKYRSDIRSFLSKNIHYILTYFRVICGFPVISFRCWFSNSPVTRTQLNIWLTVVSKGLVHNTWQSSFWNRVILSLACMLAIMPFFIKFCLRLCTQ
jgi:hypothetical protein